MKSPGTREVSCLLPAGLPLGLASLKVCASGRVQLPLSANPSYLGNSLQPPSPLTASAGTPPPRSYLPMEGPWWEVGSPPLASRNR